MKKIMVYFLFCLLLVGCDASRNSPTSVVKNVYMSYQNLDYSVLDELDEIVNKETQMDHSEKKKYKSLLEKQYQNLSFKIVDEEIIEDVAYIETEIEVLDYASSILRSKRYYLEHQGEFSSHVVDQETIDSEKEFIDFMLDELEHVNQKMKYSIRFSLKHYDYGWEIEKIHDLDVQKIQGLY